MTSVFTVKFNPEFLAANSEYSNYKSAQLSKMVDMNRSLVLILAIFIRRRSFFQMMRLISLQMKRMRINVIILFIYQQNIPGGLPYKSDGDARRIFLVKIYRLVPLRAL